MHRPITTKLHTWRCSGGAWPLRRHRCIGQSLRNSTHGTVETGLAPSFCLPCFMEDVARPVSIARPVVCLNTAAAQPQGLRPVSGTAPWYRKYHGLVLSIPRLGTACTTAWYCLYHGLVLSLPRRWYRYGMGRRHRRIGGRHLTAHTSRLHGSVGYKSILSMRTSDVTPEPPWRPSRVSAARLVVVVNIAAAVAKNAIFAFY